FVVPQRAVVVADIVDLAAEIAAVDAAAQAQYGVLVGSAGVAVGVVQGPRFGTLSVQVDPHTAGALAAVVGQAHMDPAAGFQRFGSFHRAHAGNPAGDDIELQTSLAQFDGQP